MKIRTNGNPDTPVTLWTMERVSTTPLRARSPTAGANLKSRPPIRIQALLDLVRSLSFQDRLCREEDADHDRGEGKLVECDAGGSGWKRERRLGEKD
jgi:hypothetical protein